MHADHARASFAVLARLDPKHRIVLADNLDALRTLPDGCARLVYIDPPFNTGRTQVKRRLRTVRDEDGDRIGFHGARYRTEEIARSSWNDSFDDSLTFLAPRLEEGRRILAADGSFFLHIDYREVHYCKVLLDQIFGRAKHDNILWYARDPKSYVFNFDAMDRIPYMAPKLVGEVKARRGETPTDVWWHTIVSPNGKTQKPLGVLERIVQVHSQPGDLVVDYFAGSGSMGEAAALHDRRFFLVDHNRAALRVMTRRLARFEPEVIVAATKTRAKPRSTRTASARTTK